MNCCQHSNKEVFQIDRILVNEQDGVARGYSLAVSCWHGPKLVTTLFTAMHSLKDRGAVRIKCGKASRLQSMFEGDQGPFKGC